MTDDQDRRTLISILNDYYNPVVISDHHVYSESGIYRQLEADNEHKVHDPWRIQESQRGAPVPEREATTYHVTNFSPTRKSSCVNARGTPPAAYQVLAMLLCLMGRGYPGTPHHPDLARGYPRYPPHHPDLVWGVPQVPTHHPDLGWGTPDPDLGWGTPPTSTVLGRGSPPPRKCEQTENITFPHPSDAGGKNAWKWRHFGPERGRASLAAR